MSDTPAVAAVDINLDKLRNPHCADEWNYGVGHPNATTFGPENFAVYAGRTPDADGHTVWFRKRGYTRDELPGLIAFLTATYGASALEAVEENQ